MIRPSYAVKLARTKLHSKCGMLFASTIVASLLFAALIAIIIVFTGAEKSAEMFIKKAGNDRYLVKASPNIPNKALGITNNLSLEEIRELKAFEKKYYQNLQDKYKSLGLAYDKSTEAPALLPASWMPDSLPEEQRVTVNFSSPVISDFNDQQFEKYAKTANNKLTNLKEIGSKYDAAGYYIVDKISGLPQIPALRLIQNDKEDFGNSNPKADDMTTYGYYTNAIYNSNYTFTDQQLLRRYMLATDASHLNGIPVVVSAQEAVSLFGKKLNLETEPADTNQKSTWLKNVQEKLNGHTYQVCYRNSAEQTLLKKIQQDYIEAKTNEANKDYQKPSLIYDYPKQACGDIAVKSDTRTAAEKKSDDSNEANQKKLGTYIEPKHKLLTFQIVGIKYAQPQTDYKKNASEYIKNLLASQDYSSSLDIPIQLYDSLPEKLKFSDVQQQEASSTAVRLMRDEFTPRVLEFSSVAKARAFLDNEACPELNDKCNKQFAANPYGSNYLILDEIGKLFNQIASVALPGVLGLAIIIIWFTVSRIIAENRKETAIYRAMGAKRRDIACIYIIYVAIVALRIAIVSLILGIAAAFAVANTYGKNLTGTAATAFGVIGSAPQFSIFSLESPTLIIVIGSIFIVSLIASIQPLLRNVRRNPVQDIRD